jgi:hypothetical protein
MAHRFVRATPRTDLLPELRERLDDGEIGEMDPFGEAMTASLLDARFDPEMGEAVLDDYFEDLRVVEADVDPGEGWARVDGLPSLWDEVGAESEA